MGLPDLPHLQKIFQPAPKIVSASEGLSLLGTQDSQNLQVSYRLSEIARLKRGLPCSVKQLQPKNGKFNLSQTTPPAFYLPITICVGNQLFFRPTFLLKKLP
jgi:hypothetical protein